MRALGYKTVDALVDWLNDPAAPPLPRAEMAARLAGSEPVAGSFDDALRVLFDDVLPFSSRAAHPRFFAYVPFAGTWPGALGDFIASACNVYAGSWQESAGPSQLELEILDWFKEWVSGSSASAAGTPTTSRPTASSQRSSGAASASSRRPACADAPRFGSASSTTRRRLGTSRAC
jgi:hypothetical protein